MCEDYVARFAGHFNDAYLNSVECCCVSHEPLNTVAHLVPRAQCLHPRMRSNQALPDLCGSEAFALATRFSTSLSSTRDEKSSATLRRQFGQAREEPHRC